jgi:predicted hotdog family 3-hydroxylacyl-ACP dehydratase
MSEQNLSLPVSADVLVPHGPPMLLISRLIEFESHSGVAEADINAENPLLDERGDLDRLAAVEMIAQSYAALKGYDDLSHGRSIKKGYLVGIRGMKFFDGSQSGNILEIHVSTVKSLGEFASAKGEVLRDGEVIAEGTIKVWTPDN